jgi:hypothetical protein
LIGRKERIFFCKPFTTCTHIPPFLKNQEGILHLEREILELLIAVIVNTFGLSTTMGAGLYGRIGFDEYPNIMICMNHFLNKNIF